MKISVITVCKNADAYIEQAIQSVVNQTYPNVEYLIIDGKSSDRTLDIVNAYADKIADVVSEPDDGIYAAMNKGIRKATGDFLYFLNSDDYLVDSHVFQELANFISQQPKCEFVYGQMEMRMGKGNRTMQRIPRPVSQLKEALLSYAEGPQHAASFFGRHLFDRLGLFDETYRISADYDWFLRLAQDLEAAVCYFPRMIASCSNQGLSCRQQNLGLQECFRALNDAPIYQNEDWLKQRVQHLQQQYLNLYDNLLDAVNKPARFANSSRSNALLNKTEKLREKLRQLS
ncbi:glycosyltransferase family 2 protein [Vacuolonema iberomarrocanum]|uniref:glycosyltransferase family 2 protein n=1 Tax=Vacuolonema iberomarrocanum TaxID=3454632 RepID=UPI0019E35D72|nr:glycosyltransferase [filamentous cyanobacterium LEGE 07170]